MFSFVWRGEELVAFYLGEAKHVICSVSNLGESEFCPTLDIVYPTTHAPGALLIASRMKEIGGMPTAFINSNTNTHTRVISVTLALNVELALGSSHLPVKMRESLASADLRCYKDGKPDPEYTKTIH